MVKLREGKARGEGGVVSGWAEGYRVSECFSPHQTPDIYPQSSLFFLLRDPALLSSEPTASLADPSHSSPLPFPHIRGVISHLAQVPRFGFRFREGPPYFRRLPRGGWGWEGARVREAPVRSQAGYGAERLAPRRGAPSCPSRCSIRHRLSSLTPPPGPGRGSRGQGPKEAPGWAGPGRAGGRWGGPRG